MPFTITVLFQELRRYFPVVALVGPRQAGKTKLARAEFPDCPYLYLVTQLRPWHENFGKRLIKAPKLYFTDTGLLCWLLGIESPAHLSTHAQRGAIFENWAVTEALKSFRNRGEEPNLHFWRDQAGLEIDLLHVRGSRLHALEVKSGATIAADWFKGLRKFAGLAGAELERSTLLFGGSGSHAHQGVEVRSWDSRWMDEI